MTLPAGNTTVSFNIPIIDDNVFETNQEFNLYFDYTFTLPRGIVRVRPFSATVSIVDDDCKLLVQILFIICVNNVSMDTWIREHKIFWNNCMDNFGY